MRLSYGWAVVAAAFTLMFVAFGGNDPHARVFHSTKLRR
jgi:hypothetical protein